MLIYFQRFPSFPFMLGWPFERCFISRARCGPGGQVFSNVIRTNDDQIMMINMRGQLGKVITTQGDVHYDLSKVFQSLCGYDFMLLEPLHTHTGVL